MPRNRMDDFGVTVDPRTGELRNTARSWGGLRRPPGPARSGLRRVLGIVLLLALILLLGVFGVALVTELM